MGSPFIFILPEDPVGEMGFQYPFMKGIIFGNIYFHYPPLKDSENRCIDPARIISTKPARTDSILIKPAFHPCGLAWPPLLLASSSAGTQSSAPRRCGSLLTSCARSSTTPTTRPKTKEAAINDSQFYFYLKITNTSVTLSSKPELLAESWEV